MNAWSEPLSLVFALMFVSVWFTALDSKPGSGKNDIDDHLFRTRCCPACGFDLVPSPVESDGCTVCPECGAAWRLPYHDDASKVTRA